MVVTLLGREPCPSGGCQSQEVFRSAHDAHPMSCSRVIGRSTVLIIVPKIVVVINVILTSRQ